MVSYCPLRVKSVSNQLQILSGALVFDLFRGTMSDGLGIHDGNFVLDAAVQDAPLPSITKSRNIATLPNRQSVYLNYRYTSRYLPGTSQLEPSGYCHLKFNAESADMR